MGRFVLGAALAMGLASPAAATTYTFDQANSMLNTPGFVVDATISFTGSTFGFPTVSNFNNPGPYDFTPMAALAISFPTVPSLGTYTLADFTAAAPSGLGRSEPLLRVIHKRVGACLRNYRGKGLVRAIDGPGR